MSQNTDQHEAIRAAFNAGVEAFRQMAVAALSTSYDAGAAALLASMPPPKMESSCGPSSR